MKEKNIRELAKRMGLITVENMCQYTIAELVVMVANKVNALVDEVWRFETDVQETLKTQTENIQYLLGEGLHLEVENIFDVWVQDGTFDTLINQSALKKVNDRLDETNAQLSGVNNLINDYVYAGTKLIAHRGFVLIAPENTTKSTFEACINGFDMVEMDINLTKDNQYILLHDGTIDRTTNGTGGSWLYTLEEIQQFNIDSGYIEEGETLHIPTFESCVKICSQFDKGVNIDCSKPGLMANKKNYEYIIDTLKKYKIFSKSLIATESKEKRTIIHSVDPEMTLLWTTTEGNLSEDIAEAKNYKNVVLAYNNNNGGISSSSIDLLHQNGIKVMVYNVNDYQVYMTYLNLNVDFIETETLIKKEMV